MLRVLVPLALLAVTIYAVVDCVQTDESQLRNLPKLVWVLLILLSSPIGAIAWFVAGRPRTTPGRPSPRRPLGPDDDPDFLRNL